MNLRISVFLEATTETLGSFLATSTAIFGQEREQVFFLSGPGRTSYSTSERRKFVPVSNPLATFRTHRTESAVGSKTS